MDASASSGRNKKFSQHHNIPGLLSNHTIAYDRKLLYDCDMKGGIEEEVRLVNRKRKIQRAILTTLVVGGVLTIGAIAPNCLQLLGLLGGKESRKKFFRNSLYRSRDSLLDKGYLEFVKTRDGKKMRITEKGRQYLGELDGKSYKVRKPKRWDGKFRMVIFDIKETRRHQRDHLRKTLDQIGFFQLQRSVWIYPYDCEELITLLKADYKIGKDILYVITERIEFDQPLRDHFNLPPTKT